MAHTHVASGGRYPVLRTAAIVLLLCSIAFALWGVWRGVRTFQQTQTVDTTTRIVEALGKVGYWILKALYVLAISELIKLFIDIEHNTRMYVSRDGTTTGRTLLDGEETAEGALLRGH